MLVTLGIAAALVVSVVFLTAAGYRQARRRKRNPLEHVFRKRELTELDAHLEAVAREELHRLEAELGRYLAGRTGHIEMISKTPAVSPWNCRMVVALRCAASASER
jgi:hypothetical protein